MIGVLAGEEYQGCRGTPCAQRSQAGHPILEGMTKTASGSDAEQGCLCVSQCDRPPGTPHRTARSMQWKMQWRNWRNWSSRSRFIEVRHVTADHGFLYNARTLQKRISALPAKVNRVEESTRYFVTEEKVETDLAYCIPASMTMDVESNYWISIPKSVNRFRAGGGRQFVHGGGSLQELVVPVIVSRRGREAVSQGVGVEILQPDRLRVVSNTLSTYFKPMWSMPPTKPSTSQQAYTATKVVICVQPGNPPSTHGEEPSGRIFPVKFQRVVRRSRSRILKLKI